ncbi:MAG: Biotin--acetyl-CoA-carboxylase ligase [Gammaproteobacteria bacterium]|nr:Biotin--acetyl-CoA-carboxylase ligase [Gammaproteobacteria bacterium]
MNLFRSLVVLLIVVPLLELYILIQMGSMIGVIPTIAICVLTSVAGAALLRYQGLRAITHLQTKLAQGEFPAQDLLEGVILLIGGVLLLTPGFFTDVFGFICLVPTFRYHIARLFGKLIVHGSSANSVRRSVTLEGEFQREDSQPDIRLNRKI